MKEKFKDLFKSTKGIFVGITLLLWLAGLGLLIGGKLDFMTFIGSLSTISVAVTGLYQWYIKQEVVKENEKLSIANEVLIIKSNRLSTANSKLRKENSQAKEAMKLTKTKK